MDGDSKESPLGAFLCDHFNCRPARRTFNRPPSAVSSSLAVGRPAALESTEFRAEHSTNARNSIRRDRCANPVFFRPYLAARRDGEAPRNGAKTSGGDKTARHPLRLTCRHVGEDYARVRSRVSRRGRSIAPETFPALSSDNDADDHFAPRVISSARPRNGRPWRGTLKRNNKKRNDIKRDFHKTAQKHR